MISTSIARIIHAYSDVCLIRMETTMKKNNLILFALLLLTTQAFATQELLQGSLPELMQRDGMLRPYVRDLISSSTLPEKTEWLSSMESPASFRRLDFAKMNSNLFGENTWVPHAHGFKSQTLQELFTPYFPKPSDEHMIFLADALYEIGSRIYERNPSYLEYAASIGHVGAQHRMFFVDFKLGKLEEAKNYLFCSAAQGNPDALLTLSEVHQGNWRIGIPKDLGIAKLLCQEASGLGSDTARFRIEVATLTEGLFESERNYQQGIVKAKELADANNQRAKSFLDAIMRSSGDALQEGNDFIKDEDLDFLRSFLGWKDTGEEEN